MKRRLAALATACALSAMSQAQADSTFSNIYFLGDSLSDVGVYAGLVYDPTAAGSPTLGAKARWLTGYGPNWTDVLAARFGFTSVANSPIYNAANTSPTGNNYAQGGAQAQSGATHNNPHVGPGGVPTEDIQAQYTNYLAQHGGKIDPRAAYAVWIGGNDLNGAIRAGQASSDPQGTVAQVLSNAATNTLGVVRSLNAQGAAVVIVPNIPDPSRSPTILFAVLDQTLEAAARAQLPGNATQAQVNALKTTIDQTLGLYATVLQTIGSTAITTESDRMAAYQNAINGVAQGLAALQGNPALATGIAAQISTGMNSLKTALTTATAGYNQLVDMGLQGTHGVIRPNISALFSELLANPGKFGITNIASPYCSQEAVICTTPQIAAQSYVFSDDFHPSPATSQMIGRYIADILVSPRFGGAIPEVSLTSARQLEDVLSSRYEANRAIHRAKGTVSAWAAGNYRPDKFNLNNLNGKVKGQLFTVGADYQATDSLMLGIAASHAGGTTDVGTLGTIDNSSTLLAFSANWQSGNVFIDGDLHIGNLSMTSKRNTLTGAKNGDVGGDQRGYRIAAGMDYEAGPVVTGPRLAVNYARAKVNTVAEGGHDSTAQFFKDQSVSSLTGSLGWQVRATFGRLTPYARVDFVKEFKNKDRAVTAGLNSMPGDFTLNLGKPDSNWVDTRLGLSAQISKTVTAWGQIGATSGRKSGNQTTATVGVSASF
ncbi:autotransporter outer membrane beta-barrel domain-containing protein [Paludibacterium paludis]|uniref:Lipase n=1 Tax=Paludibacterium paludis TaxID=1225769 RepID=A0A918U782_9NEIS|nr:autotransporter domain-containing protein [Paludibacterium paludis]GGY02163.1 lipase [Paludibacterium paludis]